MAYVDRLTRTRPFDEPSDTTRPSIPGENCMEVGDVFASLVEERFRSWGENPPTTDQSKW
jgi:hypothetical protein